MKAFVKLDDLRAKQKDVEELIQNGIPVSQEDRKSVGNVPEKVKLMRADCINLG